MDGMSYVYVYIYTLYTGAKYVCMYMQYPKNERAYSIGADTEIYLSRRLIVAREEKE